MVLLLSINCPDLQVGLSAAAPHCKAYSTLPAQQDAIIAQHADALEGSQLTIEEHIHSMLVGEGLHGCTHLFKFLVTGVGCVPAIHCGPRHLLAVDQFHLLVGLPSCTVGSCNLRPVKWQQNMQQEWLQ